MATTPLTPNETTGSYDRDGYTVTVSDIQSGSNDNSITLTGRELIIFWSPTGAGNIAVTVTSVATSKSGRTGDFATTIVDGTFRAFGPITDTDGWADSNGDVIIQAASAGLKIMVIDVGKVK